MANHSSTKKAVRKTITVTAINRSKKTRIKTYIKKVLAAIESGNKEEANKALIVAQSEIMRGVASNLIKKNTGSRKVSRLASKVKAISA
jgi:small subunit ribosomal protein S20